MLLSRDELREKLVTIMTDDIDNEVVFITGHRGLGKTQLLSETLSMISDGNKSIVADGHNVSVSTTSVLIKCFIDAISQVEKVTGSAHFYDDLLGLLGKTGDNGDRLDLTILLRNTEYDDLKILYMLLSNNTPLQIVTGCNDLSQQDLGYIENLGNDSSNGKITYILVARPNASAKEIIERVIKRRKKGVHILPLAPTIVEKADANEPTSLATVAINNEHFSLGNDLVQYIQDDDDSHNSYLEMSREFRSGFSDDYFYIMANQEISNRNYINFVSVDDVLNRNSTGYAETHCIHTEGRYIMFDSLKYYLTLYVHRDEIIRATQTRYFDMIDQTSIRDYLGEESRQIALRESITVGSLLRGNTEFRHNEISPGYTQYYSGLLRLVSYQMQKLRSGEGKWLEAIKRLRILDSTEIYCSPGMIEAFIDLFGTTQACYLLDLCLTIVDKHFKCGRCRDISLYKKCLLRLFEESLKASYRWLDIELMKKVVNTHKRIISEYPQIGKIPFELFRINDSLVDADRYLIDVIRREKLCVGDVLMPKDTLLLCYSIETEEFAQKLSSMLDEHGYMLRLEKKEVDRLWEQDPCGISERWFVAIMDKEGVMHQMKKEVSSNNIWINHLNSAGNTAVTAGSNSPITFVGSPETHKQLVEEIDSALELIKGSHELEEEQRETLKKILTQVQEGAKNGNSAQMVEGKSAFGYIKSFLMKGAPTLIGALANMAKIASFFGLGV